jgi:outer membrane protein assembly factor BamB
MGPVEFFDSRFHLVAASNLSGGVMNRLLVVLALVVSVVQPVGAQFDSRRFSRPAIPPREVLDRLSLTLGWTVRLPTDGTRDGIGSLQILPGKVSDQILVQARSGMVQLMDAETGDLIWRTSVGTPYEPLQAAAYNSTSIIITRKNHAYVLSRRTGRHQVFHIEKRTGYPFLGFELENIPTATPVASEAAAYFPSVSRIATYLLPKFEDTQLTLPSIHPDKALRRGKPVSSPQPVFFKGVLFGDLKIGQPLVLYGDRVAAIGDDGTFIVINRVTSETLVEYRTNGPVRAPMAHYDEIVYVGSEDYNVYALNMNNGELYWRFLAGGPVTRQPQVTFRDLFVTAQRKGMTRVTRETGRPVWRNPEAEVFLAVNQQFVYAVDNRGSLLVLDYLRGTTLARYDIKDYVVPISNDLTDRIYLAAHDGSIVCLHHRAYRQPYYPSAAPEPPPPPAKDDGKKPAEK